MSVSVSVAWLRSVVGAGLVMAVCCAGPLLLAGGALGAVGGILANGWLITVGPVILLAGTGYALQCRVRRRGAGPQDCCPTVPAPPAPQAGETPDRDDPR
ncbi:hypothetical protein ACOZDZ_21430 [Streptomyces griseoincarnatus]